MEEGLSITELLRQSFGSGDVDVRTFSPLPLAFVGDSIYDLLIRTIIVQRGNRVVEGMHKTKSNLVKAQTQALMAEALKEELTDEEASVYRRGRNATTHSAAKHASIAEYRMATGFEALCGYLYLTGRLERLVELIIIAFQKLDLKA